MIVSNPDGQHQVYFAGCGGETRLAGRRGSGGGGGAGGGTIGRRSKSCGRRNPP